MSPWSALWRGHLGRRALAQGVYSHHETRGSRTVSAERASGCGAAHLGRRAEAGLILAWATAANFSGRAVAAPVRLNTGRTSSVTPACNRNWRLCRGVARRRRDGSAPGRLPALYDALLADEAALAIGAAHGLTPAEARRSARAVAHLCRALCVAWTCWASWSVDHSDFHDANILLDGGEYRFIDWGDACVAHPFLTLPVALRGITYGLGLEAGDPFLAELPISTWRNGSTTGRSTSCATCCPSQSGSMTVNRALTWRRALATVPPGEGARMPARCRVGFRNIWRRSAQVGRS